MASHVLNNTLVDKLKPTPGQQVDLFDKLVPGFGVRVSPNGSKTYFIIYRHQGRQRRLTLGRANIIGLAAARKAAKDAKALLAQNKDPALERKRSQRPPQASFRWLVQEFVEKHAKIKTKSWEETRRILQRDFVTIWGDRDATLIDKHDVNEVIDAIAKKHPGAANHAFAHVRKLFNWAVQRGYIETSPCLGLTAPAPSNARERVLSEAELLSVWEAACAMGYPYGPLIQLLILTAQRRSEVAGMEWNELNIADRLWSIPASRTKAKRATAVPLSSAAIEIIEALPRANSQLVFPSRTTKSAISGFSKWKRELDRRSGVSDWRLHDLRRTTATGLAALGIQPHLIERLLNHASAGLTPVGRIYNRFDYLGEKRGALESWGQAVTARIGTAEPQKHMVETRQ
jgi:integrase